LDQLDAETGTSDGAVARYTASVALNPQDPTAHLELGDAYWNNSDLAQAESEYKQAQTLASPGSSSAQAAAAHLARLYAAQSRYDDSLAALKDAGATGYALALGIVQGRADMLSSTLDAAQAAFNGGKSTRADFYKVATDVSAQTQALADFVVRIVPAPAFQLSHLYRVQATHLLAQQAAVLVTFIETADAAQADQAATLGKEAQSEMLTAHAAEEKLGLWGGKPTASPPSHAEEASAGR
jgi:tetratricopeptide (TPR) repeat protein